MSDAGVATARIEPPIAKERWRAHTWRVIPPVAQTPMMNMALDEVLTERVGRGERPATLRFWAWSAPCIVLGRFQSVRNEVEEPAADRLGVEIVRRISGGGAMFIQPEGAITWSLYAPDSLVAGMSFPESYAFLDAWVVRVLRDLGIDAWYAPLNDIVSSTGKIGGAAQARRHGAVLHHTTIAYEMDIGLMLQVLRIGQEKLSDKGTRSAEKRVGPLALGTQMTRAAIIDRLIEDFSARYPSEMDNLLPAELAEAARRVETRFSHRAWTHVLP